MSSCIEDLSIFGFWDPQGTPVPIPPGLLDTEAQLKFLRILDCGVAGGGGQCC